MTALVVVGAVALVGVLVFRQQQQAPAAAPPAPPPSPAGQGGGFLDDVLGGLGGGIGNFFGAVGQGAGAAVGQLLESQGLDDPSSDTRQGLHKFANTLQSGLRKLPLGAAIGVKDPNETKKKHAAFNHALENELEQMEQFAAQVHQTLSRHDVREWTLSSSGQNGAPRFDVWYEGNPKPWPIEVPPRFAAVRLAVAVEPIVRATGTTVQRGGRFGQPFVRHEPPAYDNRNPYAPTLQRVRERESKAVQNEFDKAQRVGKRLRSKDVQRALAAQQQGDGESAAEE